jgi:hypothetical protein
MTDLQTIAKLATDLSNAAVYADYLQNKVDSVINGNAHRKWHYKYENADYEYGQALRALQAATASI